MGLHHLRCIRSMCAGGLVVGWRRAQTYKWSGGAIGQCPSWHDLSRCHSVQLLYNSVSFSTSCLSPRTAGPSRTALTGALNPPRACPFLHNFSKGDARDSFHKYNWLYFKGGSFLSLSYNRKQGCGWYHILIGNICSDELDSLLPSLD